MATFKLDVGRWRFRLGVSHSHRVHGVNNRLKDGRVFPIWDFDEAPYPFVEAALKDAQRKWKLPRIYILKTGDGNHFHAYCFKAMPFAEYIHILLDTSGVDRMYTNITFIRRHGTLRISPKGGREIAYHGVLDSDYMATVDPNRDITDFVSYWTQRL